MVLVLWVGVGFLVVIVRVADVVVGGRRWVGFVVLVFVVGCGLAFPARCLFVLLAGLCAFLMC